MEARALGRGGVSLMARISGLARSTIYHGLSDVRHNVSAPEGRTRQKGGWAQDEGDPGSHPCGRSQEPGRGGDAGRPDAATVVDKPQLAQPRERTGEARAHRLPDGCRRSSALQANSKTREGSRHIGSRRVDFGKPLRADLPRKSPKRQISLMRVAVRQRGEDSSSLTRDGPTDGPNYLRVPRAAKEPLDALSSA